MFADALEVWRAYSLDAQSAYGTAVSDEDIDQCSPLNEPELAKEDLAYEDDSDEVGKGVEWATEQDLERRDTSLNWSGNATSRMAAWIAAFGLGTCASAQQEATAAYKHTLKFSVPNTTGRQNPVTTIVEMDGAGQQLAYRDMAVESFGFSGKFNERVKFESAWRGSGYTAANTISQPTLARGSFLRMRGGQLQLGESASLVDETDRWKEFSLKVNNSLMADDGYVPGSGLYRGRCHHGKRSVELQLKIIAESTVERAAIEANTELKAVLTFTGAVIESTYYHDMTITMEKLKYKVAGRDLSDNRMVYTLDCLGLYNASDNGPLKIEVTNTDTYYLAAA